MSSNIKNIHLLYKAIKSICLYVCLSVPPPFRHDRRTATKFGMHMRIDLGIIRP